MMYRKQKWQSTVSTTLRYTKECIVAELTCHQRVKKFRERRRRICNDKKDFYIVYALHFYVLGLPDKTFIR